MKKGTRYKVRFHLGAGENFMHWRIEDTVTKRVDFIDPEKVTLFLSDCFLRNQKAGADKIHRGETVKTVVAWIECVDWIMVTPRSIEGNPQVKYNPHVKPNWDLDGVNVDKSTFSLLMTSGSKVFIA